MKNQYIGDVGDYGKYGLLRFLSSKGLKIGVNWYLTLNDGNNNGKKTAYFDKRDDRLYDPELFDFLRGIAGNPEKTVRMIEESRMIQNACYYHELIGTPDRTRWHKQALEKLTDAELIFCDPDNGTIGQKSLKSRDAEKYISPTEIADYYNRGQNVVYYCHKARRTEDAWTAAKLEMLKYLPDAKIYILTYHRGTQRSYIFVIHPEDYRAYCNMLYEFERTQWCWDRLFTREFSSNFESKAVEKQGQSIIITRDDGSTVQISVKEDGWVETVDSRRKGTTVRMRADHFLSRIL